MFDIKIERGFYPLTKVRNTGFGWEYLGQKSDKDTGTEYRHSEGEEVKEEGDRQDGRMIYSMPRIQEHPQEDPSRGRVAPSTY